jgi:hypothetical protein
MLCLRTPNARSSSSARKEAAALIDEIACLQARLDELIRKRDDLHKFVDVHLALVSPAHRLPEEVIRAIFVA